MSKFYIKCAIKSIVVTTIGNGEDEGINNPKQDMKKYGFFIYRQCTTGDGVKLKF
jgi:hypothetical protein